MSDSPYDVDGALKWAETSRKMNADVNPAEIENCMDYVALQTLANEVRKYKNDSKTQRIRKAAMQK
jgi:uracil-DNA glycosylase